MPMPRRNAGPDTSGAPDRPSGREGGFVLSLDFELVWGVRQNRGCEGYRPNILGAREVIPKLLDMFERHGIACTWATVGLLFFDRRAAMEAALPERRPIYRDAALSAYGYLAEVGEGEESDPCHFGLSLLERIRATPRQEIGTHTFSHFFVLDADPDPDTFAADLAAARAAAERLGLHVESLVLPRNQVSPEALRIAAREGIATVRGPAPGWFNAPRPSQGDTVLRRAARLLDAYVPLAGSGAVRPRVVHGLVDVPASRFLRPVSRRLAPLERLRASRILNGMRAAARTGRLFHLWFHPHNFGTDQERNLAFLDRILAEARRLDAAHGWPSLSMGEVGRRLRGTAAP